MRVQDTIGLRQLGRKLCCEIARVCSVRSRSGGVFVQPCDSAGGASVSVQRICPSGTAGRDNWVAQHANDPDVRIVDMRDDKAYAGGHIPGAVHIEEDPLRNPEERFTYLPRPEVFADMMSKAGIGNMTHVIIYDDQGGKMA